MAGGTARPWPPSSIGTRKIKVRSKQYVSIPDVVMRLPNAKAQLASRAAHLGRGTLLELFCFQLAAGPRGRTTHRHARGVLSLSKAALRRLAVELGRSMWKTDLLLQQSLVR